jgi:cell division septation protein DedD
MASSVILVGAVALGTGLICLVCGYLWGRSNVRSLIEDALDKARISADAREFSVREELDEKMLELAELRASAEEVPRLREQLEQLKSERTRGSVAGRVSAHANGNSTQYEQMPAEKVQPPPPPPESADKAIQNLLKSIEERMKQAEEAPRDANGKAATPPVKKFAVEIPPTVTQLSGKPAPAELPVAKAAPAEVRAAKPTPAELRAAKPAPAETRTPKAAPAVKDEWQEFAASLDALRNRQK